MNKPRVLVMKQDSLLNQAVATILKNSECEVKVITSGSNEVKGLIAEALELKPDIVILGESMPLARKEVLGHLLMTSPELQVIVVSEDTNWIHIFHKKDKLMTRQTDLSDVLCID
jgi:DNA-binding NarL/FixJ family response regulator